MFWDVRGAFMRFIGSKANLLKNIDIVISENTTGNENVFCDIFSGTGSVARYFKPRYEVHSNDALHFSYVIQKATIENNSNDFIIPLPQSLAKSDLAETKEKIREKTSNLSHEYLALIDLAYDSKQNRLFEMKTLDLLTEECGYQGLHLGGSRKPDGVIYTNTGKCKYGVIIDTKAYSKGYNLPISQADEMERYIGENQTRNEKVNSNKWWDHFSDDLNEFYFMFVSGHFIGNFKSQIERISRNKGIKGTALAITNLLLCVEAYKSGRFTHETMKNEIFNNTEYIFNQQKENRQVT